MAEKKHPPTKTKTAAPPTPSEEPSAGEARPADPARQAPGPAWEAELDNYPLREEEEDPRWARRMVRIWIGFVLLSLAFVLTLLILGAMYD